MNPAVPIPTQCFGLLPAEQIPVHREEKDAALGCQGGLDGCGCWKPLRKPGMFQQSSLEVCVCPEEPCPDGEGVVDPIMTHCPSACLLHTKSAAH